MTASKKTFHYRLTRHFWMPFTKGDLQVIIGRFSQYISVEPSGFSGGGDVMGLVELCAHFARLKVGNLKVSYADQLSGDALKTNLILIGGPDANTVSREALARIQSKIRFGGPAGNALALYDSVTEKTFAPNWRKDSKELMDYGLIIKTSNPFKPNKQLILIAGSYGYGTWGGVRHLLSKKFIKNAATMENKSMECLIEVDVVRQTPQDIRQVLLRQIE